MPRIPKKKKKGSLQKYVGRGSYVHMILLQPQAVLILLQPNLQCLNLPLTGSSHTPESKKSS